MCFDILILYENIFLTIGTKRSANVINIALVHTKCYMDKQKKIKWNIIHKKTRLIIIMDIGVEITKTNNSERIPVGISAVQNTGRILNNF